MAMRRMQHGTTQRQRWLLAVLCLLAPPILMPQMLRAQAPAATSTIQTPAVPNTPVVQGEAIDRVVAIVNNDLVLDSDVDEERRFEAFQPYRDVPVYSREKSIERLINRALILQQARLTPEDPITDSDLDKEMTDVRKSIPACKPYHCETDAGWKAFLAAQGMTEEGFRAHWKQRMQVLAFIEERFRQGIRITEEEEKTYYETKLLPQFTKQGTKPPALADVAGRIQEVLLEQQVSSLLSDWLQSLRAQGQVVVLHPGETAP